MTFNEFMLENFNVVSYSTFWSDFSIAEKSGENAIKNTFKDCMQWKDNVKMWTELTIVLNKRCWDWYYKNETTLSEIYSKLYYKALEIADDFTGKDAEYFFRMTD